MAIIRLSLQICQQSSEGFVSAKCPCNKHKGTARVMRSDKLVMHLEDSRIWGALSFDSETRACSEPFFTNPSLLLDK